MIELIYIFQVGLPGGMSVAMQKNKLYADS
jgi:hypothetical protein